MKRHKIVPLGKLLNKDQVKKLLDLKSKNDMMSPESHKKVLEIINEDDSRWKDHFIPEYLSYAIQIAVNSPMIDMTMNREIG